MIASALLATGCSRQPPEVGSYIYSDPQNALMVQINSIQNNGIQGVLSFVQTDSKGVIDTATRSFFGTLENGALNLTIQNWSGGALATGKITNDGMQVTFFNDGKATKILLSKRDADDFVTIIDEIQKQSVLIKQNAEIAARQAEEADQRRIAEAQINAENDFREAREANQKRMVQEKINDLAGRLAITANELPQKIEMIDNTIKSYQRISTRASELKSRINRIEKDSYEASQINRAIENNRDLADRSHQSIQDYWERLQSAGNDVASEASSLMATCQASSILQCNQLEANLSDFHRQLAAFNVAKGRENAAFETGKGNF